MALTANVSKQAQQQFEKAGMCDVLNKPIEMQRLKTILHKWIPQEKLCMLEHAPEEAKGNTQISMPGIDVEKGIITCGGSEADYLDILKTVYEDGLRKYPLLQKYVLEENFERYIIDVHALKSVSASVGAFALSEKSKEQEMAGKAEKYAFIKQSYGELLELYSDFLETIGSMLKEKGFLVEKKDRPDDEKQEITEEQYLIEVSRIRAFIDEFEREKALEQLDRLWEFRLEEPQKQQIAEAKEALELFDFDLAGERLRQ